MNKIKNGKLLNLLIINVSNISFYEKSLGELGPELTRVRACLQVQKTLTEIFKDYPYQQES